MTRIMLRHSLLVGLLLSPSLAHGQAPAEAACTYEACALRVHQRFASTWIVRGMREDKTLKLGFTATGLDSLVAASDSAVAYARVFQHHHTVAGVLNLLSIGAGLSAWLAGGDHKTAALGFTIGSFGFGFAASQERRVASNALSRTLFWYNGTLSRNQTGSQTEP